MRPWYDTQQQGKPESKRLATQEKEEPSGGQGSPRERWAAGPSAKSEVALLQLRYFPTAGREQQTRNERADDRERTYHRLFPETQTTKPCRAEAALNWHNRTF